MDNNDDPNLVDFRADFEMTVIEADDNTRVVTFVLKPDSRRYDTSVKDGKTFYTDKFLGISFDTETLGELAKASVGVPSYYLSSTIDSSSNYAAQRKVAIEQEFTTGNYTPPDEEADVHTEFLLDNGSESVTFISVDICNSSAMRSIHAQSFEIAYELFIRELGTVVGQFHGAILKVTGDGFIAYVRHPSVNSQCDAAIDMCLTFLSVLRDSINPILRAENLPEIDIRIGADFGTASVRDYSIPTTQYHTTDVVSDALNRAVKIERHAAANEFHIGRCLYERIHVQWLLRASPREILSENEVGLDHYQTYRIQ